MNKPLAHTLIIIFIILFVMSQMIPFDVPITIEFGSPIRIETGYLENEN